MKRDSLVQQQCWRRPPEALAYALLLGLVHALPGCRGGDAHELGYTIEAGLIADDPAQPSTPFYTDADGFIGRWLGEAREPLAFGIEDDEELPLYAFPSGSSQFVLDIAPRPRSTDPVSLGGSLTFGSGQAPPAATDPDRGYPIGFDYERYRSYDEPVEESGGNYDEGLPPLEGFRYVLESSSFAAGVPDGVLRMVYNPYGHLQSWCALQQPELHGDGTFGVLPSAPGGVDEGLADGQNRECAAYDSDLSGCPADLDSMPPSEYLLTYRQCVQRGPELYRLSCDKVFLSLFCTCTVSRCNAGNGRDEVSLLLRITGDGLIGVLQNAIFLNARGLVTPLGEVRFRRLPD